MLFHEREQQREFEIRESAGESVWTSTISALVRNKIIYLLRDSGISRALLDDIYTNLKIVIERSTGLVIGNGLFVVNDIVSFLVQCEDKYFLSALEAICIMLEAKFDSVATGIEVAINNIFLRERISYEMINGQIVPFSSRELHVEIVDPVLRLLGGRSGWKEVETTYQKALQEIGVDPGDAITDATTAIQVALTKLGCKGNALGPLTQSAIKLGLLAPHDKNLLDWLSADRSRTGDAHMASKANHNDAWFVVHVAGALILRLADGSLRAPVEPTTRP